ncbi:ubiquinol oxidase subunit II [Hyphomicrobium methylovorum]|uniref:ubiquinol oxidase subunit II n=1 Tax=Hyphomicrobium methylovorum TaxID=84 RepID=UPI0015E72EDE|nr:ubiquinol oxidase subunit II [Hyphomicrobium methylovorum]MBA2126285.1 ubiquinol oxidase subunit II [Hyphomicrobium methylovorum]
MSFPRRLGGITVILLCGLLAGCQGDVLDPAGDIALQQRNLIYISTVLMLLIIVPVLILIVLFAWRYRESNKDASYDPKFHHSTGLELVIWSIPLLVIICLGAVTWSSTHLLDPFRRLDRIAEGKPADRSQAPLVIQVVSLDWKWLFIYPKQNVASINELVLPVDREVRFDMTSANMMNTFYAPTLAGMIYTMPGMRSQLHAVLNRPGEYQGLSANYSGAGFSDMRFRLRGIAQSEFDQWLRQKQATSTPLTTRDYLKLAAPTEKNAIQWFSAAPEGLFDRIVNRCVKPGQTCISEHMKHAGHNVPSASAEDRGSATASPHPPSSDDVHNGSH